jgi:hypothetical protein
MEMFTLADAIVGFWFLPVMLFIIIPLLMLCGWTVFKAVLLLQAKRQSEIERDEIEEYTMHYAKN